jgi:hypothetical protein
MFGSLIEGIRSVVEGDGQVDAIDKWSRQRNSGNKFIKKQRSKMIRKDAKQKLAKGDDEGIRRDVRGGHAS